MILVVRITGPPFIRVWMVWLEQKHHVYIHCERWQMVSFKLHPLYMDCVHTPLTFFLLAVGLVPSCVIQTVGVAGTTVWWYESHCCGDKTVLENWKKRLYFLFAVAKKRRGKGRQQAAPVTTDATSHRDVSTAVGDGSSVQLYRHYNGNRRHSYSSAHSHRCQAISQGTIADGSRKNYTQSALYRDTLLPTVFVLFVTPDRCAACVVHSQKNWREENRTWKTRVKIMKKKRRTSNESRFWRDKSAPCCVYVRERLTTFSHYSITGDHSKSDQMLIVKIANIYIPGRFLCVP